MADDGLQLGTAGSGGSVRRIRSSSLTITPKSGRGDVTIEGGTYAPADEVTLTISGGTIKEKDGGTSNVKLAVMANKTYKGRHSGGTGSPEDVSVTNLKSDLAIVAGDVGGLGSFATVTPTGIPDGTKFLRDDDSWEAIPSNVTADEVSLTLSGGVMSEKLAGTTNAKLADMASGTYKGRHSVGTGVPEDVTATNLKADLAITEADVANLVADLAGKVPVTRLITAGTGLAGGGALSADRTVSMPNIGPGITGPIGDATHVPAVSIDAQGRVTALTSVGIAGATPGLNLVPTAVKTANYNLAASDLALADVSASAFTFTLPTAPADKTTIGVLIVTAGNHTLTIACGGADVFNKAGGATTQPLLMANQTMILVYQAATGIWLIETHSPFSANSTGILLPAATGQHPRITFQGYNTTDNAIVSGYITMTDADPHGNAVFASTTGNVRILAELYDGTGNEHIGLNIGNTAGSAVTIKRDGGGHAYITIRNSDAQTTGASPQSVDIKIDATGNMFWTQTAGVTLFNKAIACRNVAGGITQALVMANDDYLAGRSTGSVTTKLIGLDATDRVALGSGGTQVVGAQAGAKFTLLNGAGAGASNVGGALYFGTGAPVNASGTDGDLYFRVDGGVLSTIYQRRAAAWVGVV